MHLRWAKRKSRESAAASRKALEKFAEREIDEGEGAGVATTTWITDVGERRRLGKRAQLLAAASVTYNVVEAVVAIGAGLVAGSVALLGYGLDSVVEVSSGLIILWQFRHPLPESRERIALRLLAGSFFALAGYVSFESVQALGSAEHPGSSPTGVGLAAVSRS
jgi:divalent metal cation (Fe/Co/Zn/Cd) transporter